MKMSRFGDEGLVVPLYMSYGDCAVAVEQATNAETFSDGPMEITCLSLQSVAEQIAGFTETSFGAIVFVPPTASLQHAATQTQP